MSKSTASPRVAVVAVVSGTGLAASPLFIKDLKPIDDVDVTEKSSHQFVLFASLDMVEEKMWHTPSAFLHNVDTFRDLSVSVWITSCGDKILLLHRGYSETPVRQFLKAMAGLWLRVSLNPLRDVKMPVTDIAFEDRVRAFAAKWLS
jgi:hypothetical protein